MWGKLTGSDEAWEMPGTQKYVKYATNHREQNPTSESASSNTDVAFKNLTNNLVGNNILHLSINFSIIISSFHSHVTKSTKLNNNL